MLPLCAGIMGLHKACPADVPHATENIRLALVLHCNLCTATQQPHPRPLHLQDFQSKELPNSRIQPDRRWFGNTRVVGQKQLEQFRSEMSTKVGQCLRGHLNAAVGTLKFL